MQEKLLEYLDRCAYNRPDVIPCEIQRNDQAVYRIYFRFMCCIYMLHKNGILDAEVLKMIKRDFLSDIMIFDTLFKANLKGEREFRKLNSALTDCRKNPDCKYCRAVSMVRGATTRADEPDIEVSHGI